MLVLMIMIEIPLAANIERRTPNAECRGFGLKFDVQCSVFGVRCLLPNLFSSQVAANSRRFL